VELFQVTEVLDMLDGVVFEPERTEIGIGLEVLDFVESLEVKVEFII
jgi:hypothetical protein